MAAPERGKRGKGGGPGPKNSENLPVAPGASFFFSLGPGGGRGEIKKKIQKKKNPGKKGGFKRADQKKDPQGAQKKWGNTPPPPPPLLGRVARLTQSHALRISHIFTA